MTLRQYLTIFREHWLLVVAGTALGVLVAGVVTATSSPRYESETTFYVSTQNVVADATSAYDGTLLAQEKVKSYVELLEDPRIAADVSSRLGVDPGRVAGAVSAVAPPETALIRMTVTDASPVEAQRLAGAVADEFVGLVAQLERPADPAAPPAVAARVVRPPSFSATAVSPVVGLNLAMGVVLGLLVGLGAAVARSTLDQTVKRPEVLAALVDSPVLGSVSADPRFSTRPVRVHDDPWSVEAEAYRHIRTNLGFLAVDSTHKVIVATSALPGEGKTSTLCNVAAALGQEGQRVVLVDADLRRPSVAKYLDLEPTVGLTSVLTRRASFEEAVQPWAGGLFDVLASGSQPPNPSELLASRRMTELVATLRERYDVVLVDSPPVLPVTDAALISAHANGIVLMARHGKTTRTNVERAVRALAVTSTPVVGAVLTIVPRTALQPYRYQSTEVDPRTAPTSGQGSDPATDRRTPATAPPPAQTARPGRPAPPTGPNPVPLVTAPSPPSGPLVTTSTTPTASSAKTRNGTRPSPSPRPKRVVDDADASTVAYRRPREDAEDTSDEKGEKSDEVSPSRT